MSNQWDTTVFRFPDDRAAAIFELALHGQECEFIRRPVANSTEVDVEVTSRTVSPPDLADIYQRVWDGLQFAAVDEAERLAAGEAAGGLPAGE